MSIRTYLVFPVSDTLRNFLLIPRALRTTILINIVTSQFSNHKKIIKENYDVTTKS